MERIVIVVFYYCVRLLQSNPKLQIKDILIQLLQFGNFWITLLSEHFL